MNWSQYDLYVQSSVSFISNTSASEIKNFQQIFITF